MADSDEESERRRSRDKFRRERSDYDNRRRPGDKREPFDDRSATLSVNYGLSDRKAPDDGRLPIGDREKSPLGEPPYKRVRKDYDNYKSNTSRRRDNRNNISEYESIYRPPLLPFKRFLEPLDDLITEEEACSKYREYKDGFTKRNIEEFFDAHKSEEWLRLRYHPDYMDKRKEAMISSIKNRLSVFLELWKKGFFENQNVQMDNSENLIKLMDSVVIKLEGGTDEDLKVLDEPSSSRYSDEDVMRQRNDSSSVQASRPVSSGQKSEGEADSDIDEDSDKGDELAGSRKCDTHTRINSKTEPFKDEQRGRTSSRSVSSGSSRSSSVSSSGSDNADDDFKREPEILKQEESNHDEEIRIARSPQNDDADSSEEIEDDVPTPTTAEAPGGATMVDNPLVSPSIPQTLIGNSLPSLIESDDQISKVETDNMKVEIIHCKPEPNGKIHNAPRPLHKTTSIFFRALPPSLTEAELKELCSSQPGFMRLALWEPVPERRFMRHAWATYEPTANIKKICWALNTSPLLREKLSLPSGELGATVNRDLAQRVRPLTPLTRHKPVMRQDLSLAAQLIARLDSKYGLWSDNDHTTENETNNLDDPNKLTAGGEPTALDLAIKSKNIVLQNLTDYLVDDTGGEEEALLAEAVQSETDAVDGKDTGRSNPVTLESDPSLAKMLDLLILYLRIVHSVDYYAGAIYPMEDLMPHRCGILHARGDRGLNPTVPGGRATGLTFSQREIDDHLQNFASKIRPLIDIPQDLTIEEMKKIGYRDPERAAEEFIEANIQKRTGKKKPFKVVWVCPLSDKKFREPIFVRKHIFNKHADKIEAAKKDNAIFFNNYLRDPRRPALPEAPYHLINQYYPSNGSNSTSYRGSRGSTRIGGSTYRGGYRPMGNSSLLSSNTGSYGRTGVFQDYYDVAAQQQQQHQAITAMAAAAAAALYPNAKAADLYALAAAGAGAPRSGLGGQRRGQRVSSPSCDYGNRLYLSMDNRRRQPTSGGNRRPYGDRGMISYNDLDDPGNEAS